MKKKNVLILCGGGSSEHDISLLSSRYIYDLLEPLGKYNLYYVEIGKDRKRTNLITKEECSLTKDGVLLELNTETKLDYVIPYLHGYPGETGDIQSVLTMMDLPYLGANSEASKICFNKISTKLWLNAFHINNTPFQIISNTSAQEIKKAEKFLELHKDIFVKASSQGSSVGCYQIKRQKDLESNLKLAFQFSDYVIIEKTIDAKELEVAVYDYQGKTQASMPGEIICPSKFYTFEEKYSKESVTKTILNIEDINKNDLKKIKDLAIKAFNLLKLKDLSRIDFFYTQSGEILINEINTIPGMTPISMFPKMMENSGVKVQDWLCERIDSSLK